MRELIIYCDESSKRGRKFSNFYGGVMTDSDHLLDVVHHLESAKTRLRLSEIKWQKVDALHLDQYKEFTDIIFSLLQKGALKARIMFTQNTNDIQIHVPEYHRNTFYKLYYQFIKWGFGLPHRPRRSDLTHDPIFLRLFFDQFPDKNHQDFRQFIYQLQHGPDFSAAGIMIRPEDIVDVDSKNHILLQATDLLVGCMNFRLNEMHLEKNPETNKRGKRTKAKENLYKYIYSHINKTYNGHKFNIGISTGINIAGHTIWSAPYRHWNFRSNQYPTSPY